MNSRALIKGFFDSRSVSGPSAALVNHQLGSFNDFLPHDKNQAPWMQRVVDNISVGADATNGKWNLIGNPFPTYLDLNHFYSDNSSNFKLISCKK